MTVTKSYEQTLLTLILVTVALSSLSSSRLNEGLYNTKEIENSRIRRRISQRDFCGEGNRSSSSMTRICYHNDTVCGFWSKARYFHGLMCKYRDITPESARKCLGNRTLAFIGDSIIRDIGVGVVFFLQGESLMGSPSEKFDYKHDLNKIGTRIGDFPFWKNNVPGDNYNGHIFPLPEVSARHNYKWQIQIWSLYRNVVVDDQVDDVLNNKVTKYNNLLRPIDLAFWSYGLHDWGWWDKQPYGVKYWEQIVRRWLDARKRATVPTVWVSMNPQCYDKLQNNFVLSDRALTQVDMVENANYYVNQRMLKEKLPYWDAGSALRTKLRCNVSADGVHVKMYVDIMRAKMLFNYLCDKQLRWRGSPQIFI